MKLLVKVGYVDFAIPVKEGINISSLIEALSTAKEYDEKGYGSDARYVEKKDSQVEMILMDDSRFDDTCDDLTKDLLDRLSKAEEAKSELNSAKYKVERDFADYKKKIEALGIKIEEKVEATKAAPKNDDTIPF